jgi:hypothetical protein
MDEATAKIHVAKYNRALLKKTIRDVEKSHGDTGALDGDELRLLDVGSAPPPRSPGVRLDAKVGPTSADLILSF